MADFDQIVNQCLIILPILSLLGLIVWNVYLAGRSTEVVEEKVEIKEKPKKKKKKPAKNREKAEEVKAKPQKVKNIHKIVPIGKVAHCNYCEVYMDDDLQLENHEKGKKHLKNCKRGDEKWYSITAPPTSTEKEEKFNGPEDVEDGWTL